MQLIFINSQLLSSLSSSVFNGLCLHLDLFVRLNSINFLSLLLMEITRKLKEKQLFKMGYMDREKR